jgi:hypothetical protein
MVIAECVEDAAVVLVASPASTPLQHPLLPPPPPPPLLPPRKGQARRRGVEQYDPATDCVVASYTSGREASRATNVHQSAVSACCTGRLHSASGLCFRFTTIDDDDKRGHEGASSPAVVDDSAPSLDVKRGIGGNNEEDLQDWAVEVDDMLQQGWIFAPSIPAPTASKAFPTDPSTVPAIHRSGQQAMEAELMHLGSRCRFFYEGAVVDGRVEAFLPAAVNEGLALWHVRHDDGDAEDLEETELTTHMQWFEDNRMMEG